MLKEKEHKDTDDGNNTKPNCNSAIRPLLLHNATIALDTLFPVMNIHSGSLGHAILRVI